MDQRELGIIEKLCTDISNGVIACPRNAQGEYAIFKQRGGTLDFEAFGKAMVFCIECSQVRDLHQLDALLVHLPESEEVSGLRKFAEGMHEVQRARAFGAMVQ